MTTLERLLDEFDRNFAAGNLDDFAALFADDAKLLFHNRPTVTGRGSIREAFGEVFEGFDTSDYHSDYQTVEAHADAAYVIGEVVEVLRRRAGGPGTRVRARIVLFLRLIGGEWRISRLVTARSGPDEQL